MAMERVWLWDNCGTTAYSGDRGISMTDVSTGGCRKKWVLPKINLLAKITKGKVEARVELGV